MWELDHKEGWELWCWRIPLRVPWTARRSNQSILKKINPEYSLQGLMLKLKLQYSGHLMPRANSLGKTLMLGKIEGGRRRMRMVGWHHQLNGHEFEQTPGDSERQGSLACCSSWGHRESDMLDWLNNNIGIILVPQGYWSINHFTYSLLNNFIHFVLEINSPGSSQDWLRLF